MTEKDEQVLIQCRPTDMLDKSITDWLLEMKFEFHLSTFNGMIFITALPSGWSQKDTGKSSWENSPWHIWDIYDSSGKRVADFDSDEGYIFIYPPKTNVG